MMRKLFLTALIAAAPAASVVAQQPNPVALATAAGICGPSGVADASYRPNGQIAVVCNAGGPPPGTTGSVAATTAGAGAAAGAVGLAVVAALAGSDSTSGTSTN
jgi:hypothetical protein